MYWLWLVSTAFSAWMLYDASQRGVLPWWYCVILCPGGEIAYFFTFVLPDLQRGRAVLGARRAPLSLDVLRYRLRENACLENHLDLARALYADDRHDECAELCERVVEMDDSCVEAHYGLACSRRALKDWAGAEDALRSVLSIERSYEDWAAWRDLADVVGSAGRRDDAIRILEDLVIACPRTRHTLLLARALIDVGRREEARRHLEDLLRDHALAPRHVKRLGRADVRRARALLRALS